MNFAVFFNFGRDIEDHNRDWRLEIDLMVIRTRVEGLMDLIEIPRLSILIVLAVEQLLF